MWKFFLACYTPFIFLTLNFLPLVFTQTLLLRKHNRIGCTVLASEPTDQFNFLFWETSNDIAKIHRAMACQHSHCWGYGNLSNTHKNSFLCQPSLLHSCFIAVWVQNKTTLKKMTFFPSAFTSLNFTDLSICIKCKPIGISQCLPQVCSSISALRACSWAPLLAHCCSQVTLLPLTSLLTWAVKCTTPALEVR